jgi:competence protein ComFB
MELKNTVENTVISKVDEVFRALGENENTKNYCNCNQCRMDIICYVLNRTPPHYIVSNRGASRVFSEGLERQQRAADITALIYDGLKRVNHNQRPNFIHSSDPDYIDPGSKIAVFNVPTIMGRIFNGDNFAPLSGADVELLWNGELVAMKDGNWHNPYHIVSNLEGNFSFWPAPVPASRTNNHKIFEYTLRVCAPGFETLNHFFKIPVASEIQAAGSFSLERTFKLPDLYIFPPGEAEKNSC